MAWPTTAEVKTEYAKLNNSALDTKISRAITRATNIIYAKLRDHYDITTFAATTPPLLYDIHMLLVYGFFEHRVHVGKNPSPDVAAAKAAKKEGMDMLEQICNGKLELVDSSQAKIANVIDGESDGLKMLDDSPFGLREVEDWKFTPVDTDGGEWV